MTAPVQAVGLPGRLADIAASAEREAESRAARFGWDPLTGLALSASGPAAKDPRPLSVLATKGGKSLFRYLEDERVQVFAAGQAPTSAPDLVATTSADPLAEARAGLELSDEVWRRLRSGETKLAIDRSGEGEPHSAQHAALLHGSLRAMGIAPSNCVYLTQDRSFRAAYLAHQSALGVSEPGMEVLVHDRFIQHLFASVRAAGDGGGEFRRRLQVYGTAGLARGRRFLSLNNKLVYAHRLFFLLRLLRDGLWNEGHISLGSLYEFDGRTVNRGQFLKRVHAMPELRGPLGELLPLLDRLEAMSPRYLGVQTPAPGGPSLKDLIFPSMFAEYADSWFSLVIETDVSDRLHRITEKPFKPLLSLHPFIVLGSCGSLRLIREFGFQTFGELFDESYDQEPDMRTRLEMVYEQLVRLCRMDEDDLARACQAAAGAVVFNACWGLTQLPLLFRDRIDSALVDRLIWFVRGPATKGEPA